MDPSSHVLQGFRACCTNTYGFVLIAGLVSFVVFLGIVVDKKIF
jgi:hypothetical protein